MTATSIRSFRQAVSESRTCSLPRGRRLTKDNIPADLDMGTYNVRCERGRAFPFIVEVCQEEQMNGFTIDQSFPLHSFRTFDEALQYIENMLGCDH